MVDFLSRGMAPLTEDQWQDIDKTVIDVARRSLVGRRFIPLFGPLGAGVQTIMADEFTGATAGNVDLLGEAPGAEIVRVEKKTYITLPTIYKDFRIHWRDIETSRQFNVRIDTGSAAAAANYCARAEDNLIFNGNEPLGFEGILNATGRTSVPMSDWSQMGKAFDDAVAAGEALISAGFFGPYALIVSPLMYANMNRVFADTGILEIEQVRKTVAGGVFQSAVLPEPSAVFVSTGPQNLDLVLAQDFTTAFLQTQDMNHYFRVFEIMALRIKRPQAICTLEGGARPTRERVRRREEETTPQES